MKKMLCLSLGLLLIPLTPIFGQTAPLGARMPVTVSEPPKLTRFDLDFRGGSPRDLVAAITKASGKPLNVIISDEDNNLTELPALKMNDVDVRQLFAALMEASKKNVLGPGTQPLSYAHYTTGYAFGASDSSVSDNTIWYFQVDKLPPTPDQKVKVVRYFNLEQYLNRGFTVDDITTAIKTGWKMAGVEPAPELNYHKETKMLIAFDEPGKLATVSQVLDTLPQRKITYIEFNVLSQTVQQLKDEVDRLESKLSKETPKPAAEPQKKSE